MMFLLLFLALSFSSLHLVQSQCSPSWQENRNSHLPTDLTSDSETLLHLALERQDEQDFERHLDSILIPRAVATQGHFLVENYITQTLLGLGWSVEFDTFEENTTVGMRTFNNIFAHINPDSPRRAMIACHYETMPTLEGFLGATDAAVSCAMMLNLASTMTDIFLAQNEVNPELSITLMFFDGEEAMDHWTSTDSVYGSSHIADSWATLDYSSESAGFCQTGTADYLDRMDLLFLLDLIGTPAPNFQRIVYPHDGIYSLNPWYDDMMALEKALIPLIPLTTESMFKGVNSTSSPSDDHSPFVKQGFYRILYLVTRPFPTVWHTLKDDKDCLSFEYIATLNMLMRCWTAQYLQYGN